LKTSISVRSFKDIICSRWTGSCRYRRKCVDVGKPRCQTVISIFFIFNHIFRQLGRRYEILHAGIYYIHVATVTFAYFDIMFYLVIYDWFSGVNYIFVITRIKKPLYLIVFCWIVLRYLVNHFFLLKMHIAYNNFGSQPQPTKRVTKTWGKRRKRNYSRLLRHRAGTIRPKSLIACVCTSWVLSGSIIAMLQTVGVEYSRHAWRHIACSYSLQRVIYCSAAVTSVTDSANGDCCRVSDLWLLCLGLRPTEFIDQPAMHVRWRLTPAFHATYWSLTLSPLFFTLAVYLSVSHSVTFASVSSLSMYVFFCILFIMYYLIWAPA